MHPCIVPCYSARACSCLYLKASLGPEVVLDFLDAFARDGIDGVDGRDTVLLLKDLHAFFALKRKRRRLPDRLGVDGHAAFNSSGLVNQLPLVLCRT